MPIRVEIELEDGSFATRMIHAGESVAQFQRNVGGAIRDVTRFNDANAGLLSTVRDVSIALGMARIAFDGVQHAMNGWIGDVVKVNAEMEKLTLLMKGLSTAADPIKDAGDNVKFLRDEAKNAPFSLAALTDTFVKMKSTGIDPMKGAFKGMIDAVAAFGGTDDVLKRATVAITQMSGKGVIQMEELRQQLGEAVPRAVELMARSMGVSTGQLIQTISKGTLDAKSSLQQLSMEFELTFGGAAAQQMKTFNGLIAQSTTMLQNLAIAGGEAGFMDALKKHLREFNDTIDSDGAKKMAADVGQFAGQITDSMVQGIHWVVEMRHELLNLAIAIGTAFGTSAVIKAGASMIGVFQNIRAEWAKVRIEGALMRDAFTGLGATIAGVRSMSDASAAAGLTMGALGRTLPVIGAGLMFVANAALPVVGTIALLAFQFGLLADKEKEAFDGMTEFGAATEKQIENAQKFVERQAAMVAALKAARDSNQNGEFAAFGTDTSDESVKKEEARLAQMREQLAEGQAAFAKSQRQKLLRQRMEEVDDRISGLKADFDKAQKAREETFTKELEVIQKNHGDNQALTRRHGEENRALRLEQLDREYDELRLALEAQTDLVTQKNEKALAIDADFRAKITSQQVRNREQRNQLAASAIGPQKGSKLDDIDALVEKANAKTEQMKSEVAGLKAELAGASGEYAKLAYMINEARAKGNYVGPLSNADIKAATDELLAQQKVFDEYTAKVNGQRARDAELNRVLQKAQQDLNDTVNQTKNDIDKFAVAQRTGAYDGLNSFQRLEQGIGKVGSAAKGAADAMKAAFAGVLPAVEGLNLVIDKASTGMNALSTSRGGPKPFSFSGGDGYTSTTAMREAGGDPTAKNPNSSATGLGQFIKETWLEFLKDMHPEIKRGMGNKDFEDATRQAALALRNNAELSIEAINWYKSKNANALNNAGFDASNANLRLAHFLGGGGAIAALSSGDDALVRQIPELTKAIEKNESVFRNISTVGDLKDWAARQVGAVRSNYQPIFDKDSRQPMPGGLSTTEQRAYEQGRNLLQQNNAKTAEQAMDDWLRSVQTKVREAAEDNGGKLSNYAAGRQKIRDGQGPQGRADLDPDSDRYKKLMEQLKELDAAEEASSERKKARTAFETALQKQGVDEVALAEKKAEIDRRLDEEKKLHLSAGYYAKLREFLKDQELAERAVSTGAKTREEADKFLGKQKEQLARQKVIELGEVQQKEQEKDKIVRREILSEGEQREEALKENIRRKQLEVEAYEQGSAERLAAEQRFQKEKRNLEIQAFQATPLGKMLKEYRDFTGNLQKATVGWIDSFSDGLAQMAVKGKFDFKALADSIILDIARITIRAGISNMFGGFLGLGGGAGGIVLGGAGGPGQFQVAQHHRGGIAGQVAATRMADVSLFSGAPKFHTGSQGLTLGGDEIPIIAKRGEQIDWPENLAKQYGDGGGASQVNHIAVEIKGNGGTPNQNQDLAKQVYTAVTQAAQQMISREIRTQLKPNGLLSKR